MQYMPDWKAAVRQRLAALDFDPALEFEIVEELAHHLEDRYSELLANGESEDAAYDQALAELDGGALPRGKRLADELALARRRPRSDSHPPLVLGGAPRGDSNSSSNKRANRARSSAAALAVWQDLRYGARMLARNPGFAAVAVLALALGIGANSAIFSVVNAALLRPLPYRAADRLVMIWGNYRLLNMTRLGVSALEFADYKADDTFSETAAYQEVAFNLAGEAARGVGPERVLGARVSASLFPLLGVAPLLGRTLAAGEDLPGGERVVIVSHRLWRGRFAADPALPSQSIVLDGQAYTVAGVMPEGFQFPFRGAEPAAPVDLWTPAVFTPGELADRGNYYFRMIARLRPGLTVEEARARVAAIGARFEQEYPQAYRGPHGEDGGWQATLTTMQEEVVGNVRRFLFVLLGVVGFVLLIACANVANLLLARGAARSKEIAVRAALGASRSRLFRQFLTEALLLATLGGAVGAVVAEAVVKLLVAAGPHSLPRLAEAGLDMRVAAFTFAIALLTGLLFGMVPAWRASRADLAQSLNESGRGATEGVRLTRLRGLLVLSEVAIALVLLIGAGLMIKSFRRLLQVDPGFNPSGVVAMDVALPPSKYPNQEAVARFYDRLVERVQQAPAIEVATLTSALPLSGIAFGGPLSIEGRSFMDGGGGLARHADVRTVAPGYFRALGIPMILGRDFDAHDMNHSVPVVIVNQAFAQGFFAGDPLSQRVKIGAPNSPRPWLQIAGVVRDVRSNGLDVDATPEMYVPFAQNVGGSVTLVARTAGDSNGAIAAIRGAVLAMDPDQPVYNVRAMNQLLEDSVTERRFNMTLLGAFALTALMLACSGIFGVMAYMVAQRRKEIGIRMALGARRVDVLKAVLWRGMRPALAGVAVGMLGARVATRLISGLLYGVSPTDAATFAGIAVLLLGVALAACLEPARRATRIDPMQALRSE